MGPRARDPAKLYVDVGELEPDLVALDVLARVALAVRRRGRALVLCNASSELRELIEFAGLSEVLLTPRSREPRC